MIVTTVLLAAAVSTAGAQVQQGTIAGRILPAGANEGLPGATVSVDGGGSTVTNARGEFELTGVPTGPTTVTARAEGYEPVTRQVTVLAGGTVRISVEMVRTAAQLAEITVIGSKADLDDTQERMNLIPGGVELIPAAQIRNTRQANLKDVLRFTPGVFIQPRFGAADESQLSIRGSGLRSNFHLRGVNILVNGMPYRNADGFTDFESLELMTTSAIEVYKGANAFRYGGSTLGGAINLDTKTGYTADQLGLTAQGGSFGFFKGQLSSGAQLGHFDYYGSYTRTSLDGYREWSAQERDRVNLHAGYRISPSVDARAFYFFAHVAEDLPGSLTQNELYTDPTQAVAQNVTNRWGRDYDLHHVGVQLRTQLGANQRLDVSPYFQYRDIDHPIFQVINQQSRDVGAEVRYENTGKVGGRSNRFTFGFQPAWLNMDNRQYVNNGGQHGDLTKDQKDRALGLGFYAEDVFGVTERLSLVAGLRFDHQVRESEDFFLSNGDQSDERTYNPLSPKVGFLYSLPGGGQLFGNISRAYEPPLLLELNSQTVPGFIDLQGQSSWQFELGTRGRHNDFTWDVSVYDIELTNEILNVNVQPFPGAPFTVPTYRNAPRTRHYGLEVGGTYMIPKPIFTRHDGGDRIAMRLGYTFARYKFVEDSLYQGNDIPGAPQHYINAEVSYVHPAGFSIAPSIDWVPKAYYVNSANSDTNIGWLNLGVRADWRVSATGLTVFAGAQNLTNKVFSPSVQVDNAALRYYEPVDARSFYVGARFDR